MFRRALIIAALVAAVRGGQPCTQRTLPNGVVIQSPYVNEFKVKNNCPTALNLDVTGGTRTSVSMPPNAEWTWTQGSNTAGGAPGEAPMEPTSFNRLQVRFAQHGNPDDGGDMTFAEASFPFDAATWRFKGIPNWNFHGQAGYSDINMYISLNKANGDPVCWEVLNPGAVRSFARAQTQFAVKDCVKKASGHQSAARVGTSTGGNQFCEPFCPAANGVPAFTYSLAPGHPVTTPPVPGCGACVVHTSPGTWSRGTAGLNPQATLPQAKNEDEINAYAAYISYHTYVWIRANPNVQGPYWTHQPPSIGSGMREWNLQWLSNVGGAPANWAATFECWDWDHPGGEGFGSEHACEAEICSNGYWIDAIFCPVPISQDSARAPVTPSTLCNGPCPNDAYYDSRSVGSESPGNPCNTTTKGPCEAEKYNAKFLALAAEP